MRNRRHVCKKAYFLHVDVLIKLRGSKKFVDFIIAQFIEHCVIDSWHFILFSN